MTITQCLRGASGALLLLLAGFTTVASCQLELDGAPCPCATGHVCCPRSNTCERSSSSCGDLSPSAETPAAGATGEPGGAGGATQAGGASPGGASPGGASPGGVGGSAAPDGSGGSTSRGGAEVGAGGAAALLDAGSSTPPRLRDAGSSTSTDLDASADPNGTPPEPGDGGDEGCAIVVFCDAVGPEGTICQQEACSRELALGDCVEDSYFVCGTPVALWILRTLDGGEVSIPLETEPGAP